MAQQKTWTMEQVDKHMEEHPLRTTPVKVSASAPKQAQFNVCSIWTTGRPILFFIRPMLFWKKSYQKWIDAFVAAMDAYCKA